MDRENQKWPDILWLVRHGESAANVARVKAIGERSETIGLASRDMDVSLSDRGRQQAIALGAWFRELSPARRPTVVLTSPYARACQTTDLVLDTAGFDRDTLTFICDERLREREFGVFDRLTSYGIRQRFPDLAEYRKLVGKFYHRPPGGESWCDVILRLRSVIDTLTREFRCERVLLVAHQVVVLCFRYLLERMTEEQILAIDRAREVANCSVTS